MQIVRTLNKEGIPSWGGGNGWHASYVQRLLTTRSVLGEFQPLKRGVDGKSVPAGEAVMNYFPAIIDYATWQKAQQRRQTSTPGRPAQSKGNLFSGIIFDGNNNCAMRHMSRPGTPAKDNQPAKRWYYLVSDYARLQKGQKCSSWRYEWFEAWFLNYLIRIDWATVSLEQKTDAETQIETRLAAQQEKLIVVQSKLRRLGDFVATNDRPPKTVLQQFAELEVEESSIKKALIDLEKQIKNFLLRRSAAAESAEKIKHLVAAGDTDSRLRLREEIRRRIQRIDVFSDGPKPQHLKGEPVLASGSPAIKITFLNGTHRWIFCDAKKPGGNAALLDSYDAEVEDFVLQESAGTNFGYNQATLNPVPVSIPVPKKKSRSAKAKAVHRRK